MKAIAALLLLVCISSTVSARDKWLVYYFGDSITAGQYPHWTKGSDQHYRYAVFAKNSAQTQEVKRIMNVILNLTTIERPTNIVIFAGVNDCVSGKIGKAKTAIKNLNEMMLSTEYYDVVVVKLHTKNACTAAVNDWLDMVPYDHVTVVTPKIGPKVHPTRKDEMKISVAVLKAVYGY